MTHTRCSLAGVVLSVLALMLVAGPAQAQRDFDFGQQFGQADEGPPLTLAASPSRRIVEPGAQLAIAVVFELAEQYHTWPAGESITHEAVPGWESLPTTIHGDPNDAVEFGPVQWPQAHLVQTNALGVPAEIRMYEGRQVAFVPIVVAQDAQPGKLVVSLSFFYQACTERECLSPTTLPLEVELIVAAEGAVVDGDGVDAGGGQDRGPADAGGSTSELGVHAPIASDQSDANPTITDSTGEPTRAGSVDPADFEKFDPTVFARRDQWSDEVESSAPARTFFGIPVPSGGSFVGLLVLASLAAVGGFILNLTPCVLPVIPIKVLTISKHAGSSGKSLVLGLWMAAGVVAFWMVLGLPVAFVTSVTDPSRLFGIWWVTLGIGVVIAAMGVGIMGLFQIRLPQKVYAINPKADAPGGAFLFGVMTAVLGLPCFGFVAGALLAGAATLPSLTIMVIFAALGVGMASPYVVLAAKPGWIEKIPRTGPASELVKQIMGLLLIAAAAFFVGAGVLAFVGGRPDLLMAMPWWGKVVHWWVIALMVAIAGGWLAWRTVRISRRIGSRVVFGAIGAVLTTLGITVALGMTSQARDHFWVPYTEQTLADALASGKVVVVDFTAEWCINCKAAEQKILGDARAHAALTSQGVVAIQADLTSTQAPGWAKMSELGQTGIPLLVIYGPGLDEPWQANAYTPGMVVGAIEQARGTTVISRSAPVGGGADEG